MARSAFWNRLGERGVHDVPPSIGETVIDTISHEVEQRLARHGAGRVRYLLAIRDHTLRHRR